MTPGPLVFAQIRDGRLCCLTRNAQQPILMHAPADVGRQAECSDGAQPFDVGEDAARAGRARRCAQPGQGALRCAGPLLEEGIERLALLG